VISGIRSVNRRNDVQGHPKSNSDQRGLSGRKSTKAPKPFITGFLAAVATLLAFLLFPKGVFLKAGPGFYQTPEQKLSAQVLEDFNLLISGGKIPGAFKNIQSVEFIGGTPELQKWLKGSPLPFTQDPQGAYRLEVFLDSIEGGHGTVVQYDLVEVKSGRTVWEFGRTFK
jgi:hypothetical protein